jgi:hypothetical protein
MRLFITHTSHLTIFFDSDANFALEPIQTTLSLRIESTVRSGLMHSTFYSRGTDLLPGKNNLLLRSSHLTLCEYDFPHKGPSLSLIEIEAEKSGWFERESFLLKKEPIC